MEWYGELNCDFQNVCVYVCVDVSRRDKVSASATFSSYIKKM